jgi:hypothetical protein
MPPSCPKGYGVSASCKLATTITFVYCQSNNKTDTPGVKYAFPRSVKPKIFIPRTIKRAASNYQKDKDVTTTTSLVTEFLV